MTESVFFQFSESVFLNVYFPKVYYLKVYFSKAYFLKVYFPKVYFLKVHILKVYFPKVYYLKVYFWKGIFKKCTFWKCIFGKVFSSSKFHFSRVYFPKMCCFFPKRNILSSDKKRKTSFQTFFKPESELKLSLFWWKNFSSLFGVQFKKISSNVERPKKPAWNLCGVGSDTQHYTLSSS